MKPMQRAGLIALLSGMVAGVLLAPGSASAELLLGGWRLDGDVEAGFRFLPSPPSKSESAKFEEYRDLPADLPFLDHLDLRLLSPDQRLHFEFGGRYWGQKDQEYTLGAGGIGLWEGGFEWNQIPHTFSTDARFLATEGPRGTWNLPTPRPSLNLHNAAPEPDAIASRWDQAKLFFKLTPTPDIDLIAEYTRTRKSGERPIGMAFGSPGSNFYEILEPLDQTVHDFRLRAVIARERWQLQFGYGLSAFRNDLDSVISANPCSGLSASPAGLPPAFGCAGDGGAGIPTQGRTALAPDNTAHTFTIAGGATLPWWATRISGNFTYSLRFQNQDFLPHTINTAIASPLLVLPQKSLDGIVGVTTFNANVTSRPLPPLVLTLKYRLFDFNDMTDEFVMPGTVVDDRTLTPEGTHVHRFPYTRQNVDGDARWRFGPTAAVTLGGGWERWDRSDKREVQRSNEYFAKAALDLTPWEWLLARLTYRPSFRRIGDYDTFAHLSHTVIEEDLASAAAQSQSPLLRKFDESDRDRQRVDLMLQVMPNDTVTVSFTGSYRFDNYYDSALGLQDADAWSAGVDATWTPSERIAITGGYNYESILQKQRSRSRPVDGSDTRDFPDFDWISVNTDRIHSFNLGLRASLIPGVLDLLFGARYEYALGEIHTRNPGPVTSGTVSQQQTAQAKRMPATVDSMLRLDASARYHFWKNWSATLAYAFEVFDKTNWRTDELNPFVPGVSSIWLGNNLKDYTAHIVAVMLGYRF
jgi:MtrB/PioB family decaheme-associated outer membrane protein